MPTKENLQVNATDLPGLIYQLNFLLQRIADRLDKLEGIRGTPDSLVTSGDISVLDEDDAQIHSME